MNMKSASEINLGWLAAVVAPRDVSPHPNFWSAETLTPYGVLGLLLSGRHGDFSRLMSDRERDSPQDGLSKYVPLFDAVQASMSLGTVGAGADALLHFSRHGVESDDDLALRATCAVVSSMALAEIDRSAEAYARLSELVQEVDEDARWQTRVLSMWIENVRANQAQALEYDTYAAEIGSDPFSAQDLPKEPGELFQVSRGSTVSPLECLNDIIYALVWAAEHRTARRQEDWDARIQLVRRPVPRLSWKARGRVGEAFEESLKEQYRLSFMQPNERRFSFGEEPGADAPLFEALVWHENLGSPFVRHYRSLLGMSRLLRGRESSESWLLAEGLRLLRHAGMEKHVASACLYLQQQGPLLLLRDEALKVVERRLDKGLLSESDLVILRHGAPLLDGPVRRSAFERLLQERADGDAVEANSPSWFELTEKTWQAIHGLARAEGREALALTGLIGEVVRRQELDRANEYLYANLLGLWHKSAWEDDEVQRAVSTATAAIANSASVELKRAISLAADRLVSRPIETNGSVDLQTAARYVDRFIMHGEAIPDAVVPELTRLLRTQLAATREAARKGRFSGGGLKEADIAVALLAVDPDVDLWDEVVEFLVDPLVQRDDKTAALSRLSANVDKLPGSVRARLCERASDLLDGGPEFMGQGVRPYPAGLRLLAIIGGLANGEPLSLVAQLVAKGTSASKYEAGVTLVALAHRGEQAEWFDTTCLWLTYDPDSSVRSLAGQALAMSSADWNRDGRVERLAALLQEEGTLVPLRVMAGLSDATGPVPERLRAIARSLALTHVSIEMRRTAQEFVDALPSEPLVVQPDRRRPAIKGLATQAIRNVVDALTGWRG